MFEIRLANERGRTKSDWLDSFHTFSFAEYYDFAHMKFGDLRVINDDVIGPGGGFGMHHHANMEIISIVLKGSLEHKDNLGHTGVLIPGTIQVMTAGKGITHSEYNHSKIESVHILQIWVLTEKDDLEPGYNQKEFDMEKMLNDLVLIVSRNGESDSLTINQDAKIYQSILEKNKSINFEIDEKHKYWIQVAEGSIEVNLQTLETGDGLAIKDENAFLDIKGKDKKSNFLLFSLKK